MRRNNSAPASETPIDWLAEFDAEPESADPTERPESDAVLSMFPSELVESAQPKHEPAPLLHVVPLGPPTGPQIRHGDYLGSETSFAGRVLARWDDSARRLPQYRDSMLALLRRRRKVFGATAAILVISTAATAGSLVVRRWQRPPERVSDRRADPATNTGTDVDAAAPVPGTGAALFGASAASATPTPVPPPRYTPPASPVAVTAPSATNVVAPKPSPPSPAPARAALALTPAPPSVTAASTPTSVSTSVAEAPPATSPVATAMRPAVTPASTVAPISIATPTPIATATPTPTPTPAAPPRPTPASRDEARTTAEPAVTPVSAAAADRSAIQYVLNRYRQTFDSLSVEDVAGFWPSVNIRSLSRAFDQMSSQELTFDGCTIDLRDTLADATCRGRVKYVPKVGSHNPRVDNHQWTFLLQRATSGWTIVRVDVK